ncbi:hypothetical protein B0H11DRAFT_783056 [Mycena galericulata]|nr:hypothetical protein B0H11DRAFT_783056 [Mycena galericulata]
MDEFTPSHTFGIVSFLASVWTSATGIFHNPTRIEYAPTATRGMVALNGSTFASPPPLSITKSLWVMGLIACPAHIPLAREKLSSAPPYNELPSTSLSLQDLPRRFTNDRNSTSGGNIIVVNEGIHYDFRGCIAQGTTSKVMLAFASHTDSRQQEYMYVAVKMAHS